VVEAIMKTAFVAVTIFLALAGLFVTFMLLAAQSANATDPTYLRCTYAAGTLLTNSGRFVIIGVDPDHHLIRFDEHGEVLNDTTTYRLTEMNDTTVKGSSDKNGEETQLEIDRLSGRAILYVDVTSITNRSRGERRWSSLSLNCQRTKPVM
jgi:hypothetical protein